MIFEEAIRSQDELPREIGLLDYDGGIRVMVRYLGTGAYAFITRGGEGEYALAIYDYIDENGVRAPNRLLLFRGFRTVESVMGFLSELIEEPFTSFKY